MKKIICVLLTMIALCVSNVSQAQQPTEITITDPRSFWQLSARIGYDFPMYDEDFRFIDYKGGITTGLSINYYWDWFGIQGDFDYIKNKPESNISNPKYIATVTPTSTAFYNNVREQSEDITRMFVGVGPAFKHQSTDNKFTAELALLGGLGFIKGGEIMVDAQKMGSLTTDLLTYHSGFDDQVFTGKIQARFNYFFNDYFGAHIGAYYMRHFGVNEATTNPLLIQNGYIANNNTGNVYYYEAGTSTVTINGAGEPTIEEVFGGQTEDILRIQEGNINQTKGIDLASIGVFAGITIKFPTKKQQSKIDEVCTTCDKYGLTVIAKDKYSAQILPNTDVVLKNKNGDIVDTGRTNGFGAVTFNDIQPENYTIEGKLHEVSLEGNSVAKGEFKPNEIVQKEILYTDKNFILQGKVMECNSTKPLPNADVVLTNNSKQFKKTTITNQQGEFTLHLPEKGSYQLYAKKEGYFSQVEDINANNYDRSKNLFVQLEICAQVVDCGKAIKLENILYDLDKYFIREDAKPELNKLIQFLQDNPTVHVELGSHTDSRSSHSYNQTLSQNRANAAVDYIVSQGISRSRIVAKGYGETQLLNECKDGTSCTEAQHQLNRRTEFKVICPN